MNPLITTLIASCLVISACQKHSETNTTVPQSNSETAQSLQNDIPDPLEIVLAPHQGNGNIDKEIIRYQGNIRANKNTFQSIENLGWLYVAKARESFDPGYYKLAEQCAKCLDTRNPNCPEALLLRGHTLQNLHQFKEAEVLARELVAKRGLSFDYGLLGDTLMEQGRLDEAADAYQKMVDIKPDLEAYARIAHYRWLTGDLVAAKQLMQMAVSAASPNAPESAAWVTTRLAFYQIQSGNITQGSETCSEALDFQKSYAPALLLRGRIFLADGKTAEAVEILTQAEKLNPLPEYQWALDEALQAAGRKQEAALVEANLNKSGPGADPRTYSLYLSTCGESKGKALELARNELATRGDIFTHDALAWALCDNGLIKDAYKEMQIALSQGTPDARLFFHATVIASENGHEKEAIQWFGKTKGMMSLLLPSEQKNLQQIGLKLGINEKFKTVATSQQETTSLIER